MLSQRLPFYLVKVHSFTFRPIENPRQTGDRFLFIRIEKCSLKNFMGILYHDES